MGENKNQDIERRTFAFAVDVIQLVKEFPRNDITSWKLGGQMIDSATSVHSNIVQARTGVSKPDFTNQMRIARKEAKETQKWLEMCVAVNLASHERVQS